MNFDVIIDEQTPNTPAIEDVSKFIETHKEQIEAFKKYAISRTDGIGLAANQCSLDGERFNLRMVAIKTDTKNDESCRIAIDPKITKYYGIKLLKFEGCLTWKGQPGMTVVADRYHDVDVEFYTPDGEFHKETHKGFQAQVWQHECNHINGVEENIKLISELPRIKELGRNDRCPCDSGKKLKQCCIDDYKSWK
jgi:peptide deformylase